MTAQGLITDGHARILARDWGGVFAPLGHSGEIDAVTMKAARAEAPDDCPDPCGRCQLNAYVLAKGPRGPQSGWSER